jgi:hypothetical protein
MSGLVGTWASRRNHNAATPLLQPGPLFCFAGHSNKLPIRRPDAAPPFLTNGGLRATSNNPAIKKSRGTAGAN